MPGRYIKVYASQSMLMGAGMNHPVITRGDEPDVEHYFADRDGSITIHEVDLDDFLAMGCTQEPQGPVKVVNHVEAE